MNLLHLPRWLPCTVVALAACGASPASGPAADAGAADVASAPADHAVASGGDVAVGPCGAPGNARLRVSLGLDPAIEARHPEVWFSVRCAGDGSAERVFVWNRTSTELADALAPGDYEILASSFVAPWATSSRVTLTDTATAAVSVTLPGGPPVIALLRSDGMAANGGVYRASVPLAAAGTTASVATLEVEARPWAQADGYVSLTAVVRNPCTGNLCGAYMLAGVEVRTRTDGQPTGIGVFRYADAEAVNPGDSRTVPQPLVVRGALPDATHDLQVALYGTPPAPPRP